MFKVIYGLVFILVMAACGTKKDDSAEIAEEQNDEKCDYRNAADIPQHKMIRIAEAGYITIYLRKF